MAAPTDRPRRLWLVVGAVAVLTAAWSAVAIDARATWGAQTTADEPQYLLTALSLWEDQRLDITDELADQRYRDFHEVALPVQTEAVDDSGRLLSPHDPLLPAYLAVPMGIGGWMGAKAAMAVLAGVLAGLLTWVAARRFGVPDLAAGIVVGAFSLAAPLVAYGTQVYPELPAALAVTVAIAALTGDLDRGGRWTLGFAVVALPWLGVKYAPVAVALVGLAVLRLWRDRRVLATWLGALALAGVAYLVAHRAWYGGWTVYAAGDHFVSGELSVMGSSPSYAGRSRRLIGLLLDRGFGLAAWAPGFLLVVPALAALARRRPPGWLALVVPLAAGWVTATWVALTMHGWWWPGRQVVVVVPCLVLAVAWWSGTVVPAAQRAVVGLGAAGVVLWGWLVVEVLGRQHTLIVDFEATGNPLYRAWRTVLPDHRNPTAATWVLQAGWLLALAAAAVLAWRAAAPPDGAPRPPSNELTDPDQPTHRRYAHRVHV